MFILKLGKPIAHDIKLKIIYKDNNYFKKQITTTFCNNFVNMS